MAKFGITGLVSGVQEAAVKLPKRIGRISGLIVCDNRSRVDLDVFIGCDFHGEVRIAPPPILEE